LRIEEWGERGGGIETAMPMYVNTNENKGK
jgi:hypothetical protein